MVLPDAVSTLQTFDDEVGMSKSRPAAPTEDPAVKIARDRQTRELAELDEDENERIKRAFSVQRGGRKGRAGRRGDAVRAKAGGTGANARTRAARSLGAVPSLFTNPNG